MIELMIVILVIGVLTGIMIPIINPTKQKNKALDASNFAKLEKLAQAIEAYNVAEGSYPKRGSADPWDPLQNINNLNIAEYIKIWPGSDFKYSPNPWDLALEVTRLAIYVPIYATTSAIDYYKYRSSTQTIDICYDNPANTISQALTCNPSP